MRAQKSFTSSCSHIAILLPCHWSIKQKIGTGTRQWLTRLVSVYRSISTCMTQRSGDLSSSASSAALQQMEICSHSGQTISIPPQDSTCGVPCSGGGKVHTALPRKVTHCNTPSTHAKLGMNPGSQRELSQHSTPTNSLTQLLTDYYHYFFGWEKIMLSRLSVTNGVHVGVIISQLRRNCRAKSA